MDHAKRPRRSTEEDEKTIEEEVLEKAFEEQKELTREERNLTRILEKRSVDNLNQQQAYELTNNCALFMAQMAQAIKPEGRSKENVVVTIKALGICANFMKSVALKMTEKLKEEMDGRLIVTHLPEEGMYLYVREEADGCGILQEFGCCLLFRQNSNQLTFTQSAFSLTFCCILSLIFFNFSGRNFVSGPDGSGIIQEFRVEILLTKRS